MRNGWVAALSVLGLLVLWFGRSAWGGHFLVDNSQGMDIYHLSTIYETWANHLKSGHLPLWFPEFQGGYPVASAWMYGLFYPGLVLFTFLPADLAWTWTSVLHIAFGAWGMHRFLLAGDDDAVAATTAALVFGLCEYLVGKVLVGHINLALPACWIPWVLLGVRRCVQGHPGAAGRLGLSLGLGLLAGHVQIWFYALPLVAAFALMELRAAGRGPRALVPALVGCGLAAAIAAIQWLPTLELFRMAQPAPLERLALLGASAPPHVLAAKLAPGALGFAPHTVWVGPHEGGWYFEHEFQGIGGLFLVPLVFLGASLRRPGRWFWTVVAVLGIVLALGAHSDAIAALYQVPPLSAARTPGRVMLLTVIAVSVLCGRGVSALRASSETRRVLLGALGSVVGALVLGAVVFGVWFAGLGDTIPFGGTSVAPGTALREVALPALAWSVLGAAVMVGAVVVFRRGGWWQASVPGAVVLGSLLGGLPPAQTVDSSFFFQDWAGAVPPQARGHRLYQEFHRFPNFERHGLRTLRGACHVDTPWATDFMASLQGTTARWFDLAAEFASPSRSDLLAGKYVPERVLKRELPDPIPHRLFAQAEVVTDDDAALERLVNGEQGLLMPRAATLPAGEPRPALPATVRTIVTGDPHLLEYEVSTPVAAWLFVSERYFEGWVAEVDDEAVPIERGAVMFRVVGVPPGEHVVRMRYEPPWKTAGWVLSLIGLAGAAWFCRPRGPAAAAEDQAEQEGKRSTATA